MARLPNIAHLMPESLVAHNSLRAFRTALRRCVAWDQSRSSPPIDRSWYAAWKRHLVDSGLAPTTCRTYMTMIRMLLIEAYDQGLVEMEVIVSAQRIKAVPMRGKRQGQWLTPEDVTALLDAPDMATPRGVRDRAILASMLGGGLRRSEVAALQVGNLRNVDGRWVLADIEGKHGRARTVPLAWWAWEAIAAWVKISGIRDGWVFRPVNAAGEVSDGPIVDKVVYTVVKKYTSATDITAAPHDLRRTHARLALDGGAPLEQISLGLGHASISTTQIYLGLEQDLRRGPADYIRLPGHSDGPTTDRH